MPDSESELLSIGPSSVGSANSLRRSRPRHVIYEGSEMDDSDTHSELDMSLYDADEVPDGSRQSYRISLGSDGFESILAEGNDGDHEEFDEEVEFPRHRGQNYFNNSFVSVGTESSELNDPIHVPRQNPQSALHFHQLQQQNQRLQELHRQQQEQIHEQQQRFPGAYEAASISSTSLYQYLRGSHAYGVEEVDGNDVVDLSTDQPQYQYGRAVKVPFGTELFVRSNFTDATQDPPLGTPSDPYDVLGTPPGDPPNSHPSRSIPDPNRNSAPFDEIHSQALQYLPKSMNSFLILFLMVVGFVVGFVALSFDPDEAYGYWLNQIGTLYIRLVNCAVVPMGICQVIFSVSTLTARRAILRLWVKTLGFYFVVCILSLLMAIAMAGIFRSSLKQQANIEFASSSTTFGFQCGNNKYLELTGTKLTCRADSFDSVNSTAVFPSFVDVNSAMGLPESVASLSFTQYLFALGARYVPNNVAEALSADYHISSMVIATVLGIAVTRSFRGGGVGRERGDARRNPLLRIFVHLYAALFTILDWLQSLALVAILPLTIGSVLVDPANAKLASFAGNCYSSDCTLHLNFGSSGLLFGYAMVASLGDPALPQSQMVLFLTVWKSFCGNESDLPPTPIALSGIFLVISRLHAVTNTAINLMIVRMAASTDEGRMYAQNFAL
ncbi:hypothetical protein PHYBOEH_004949 [Phytophthora boehmeriae]|uniref:Amino acid transporter n=1 Tax=Phytophthora boehmeriae TaxID=109152 RepID=A0A8T1WL33_9STRA|nr:hypothetical protein PHYBOEH_004949 [Phytophthora boehmeriae]